MVNLLTSSRARIFRVTHVDNVPWMLDHGLHCQSSSVRDPAFVPIGMADLISKRATRRVPCPPGGMLADYVPFYFTPWSMTLLNVKTGYNGVTRRGNSELVILGASLPAVAARGATFVFTDGHAYTAEARFSSDLADLGRIDWPLLQSRDFRRDPDDPGKQVRYQAEALLHRHVPMDAIGAIACNDVTVKNHLAGMVAGRGLETPVMVQPDWYF